jgi:hypothetical protein
MLFPMSSLVLIPVLLCDQRLWSDQIPALAKHAEVCVADITALSTISEMAADILEKAPRHFSLAGFSLGSQVAPGNYASCQEARRPPGAFERDARWTDAARPRTSEARDAGHFSPIEQPQAVTQVLRAWITGVALPS